MARHRDADCGVDPSLDPTLDTLAACRRRCVLQYFDAHDTETATVDELCDYILTVDPSASERDAVLTGLHHKDLPKLDSVGLIDFDARTDTIRVQDQDRWESVITAIRRLES